MRTNNFFKEFLNQGLIYGLLSSAQNLCGFFLLPLVTKFISAEEYGVYNMILLVLTIITLIFSFWFS